MFNLRLSEVEALTSSHGGEHTGSLFIQHKSPVFIISPRKTQQENLKGCTDQNMFRRVT